MIPVTPVNLDRYILKWVCVVSRARERDELPLVDRRGTQRVGYRRIEIVYRKRCTFDIIAHVIPQIRGNRKAPVMLESAGTGNRKGTDRHTRTQGIIAEIETVAPINVQRWRQCRTDVRLVRASQHAVISFVDVRRREQHKVGGPQDTDFE